MYIYHVERSVCDPSSSMSYIYLFNKNRSSLQRVWILWELSILRNTAQGDKLGSKSLRGHLGRPDLGSGSLRGHFGVTSGSLRGLKTSGKPRLLASGPPGSPRTRLGITSGSPGSPRTRLRVTSGSLRDHLARESSARVHFAATWLARTRLGVTS